MKTNKINTKSLRFKMTLAYSIILFLFTSGFVLAVNLYLNRYFKNEPRQIVGNRPPIMALNNNNIEFSDEQMEEIRDLRLRDLRKIQEISILSLFPITVLSFGIGYYLSGRFLYPLTLLQKKVDTLKDSDLGTHVDIYSEDEIGELAESFNAMSTRLKRSFDIQTQFVQDASHELKTPLAIVQANLDNALDDEEITKAEMTKTITRALDGMKRINKLTENLLDLTLPENILLKKEDIGDIILEQMQLLGDYAEDKNVSLVIKLPKQRIYKKVDRVQFGRAIFNLIENAIKYSDKKYSTKSEDAEVRIELKSLKSGEAKVSISDNGAGIPENQQSLIFERFYRVDKSRSRASGGFGLGLPITKKIIEAHNAEIGLKSTTTGTRRGTTFWIIL